MVDYKTAIIADPEGKAWDFSKKIYNSLKKKDKKYELVELNNKKFRDGEFKPKISKNVRKRNCYFIHDSSKDPSIWFTELALVNHTLRKASAQTIVDVLPYLKFGRQDRKDESRVGISAQVIANIVDLYADRMITLDVHNDSIQGFYNCPVDPLLSHSVVGDYLKKNLPDLMEDLVIGSPDAGGGKRAEAFARYLKKEVIIGYKTRKKAGEVEKLTLEGSVERKNVLFIDDILDSGGTLSKASKRAKEKGAKNVGAYITHGLFTKGTKQIDNLDYLLLGDTIPQKQEILSQKNIFTISFTNLFAESIYRLDKGESISELFD